MPYNQQKDNNEPGPNDTKRDRPMESSSVENNGPHSSSSSTWNEPKN